MKYFAKKLPTQCPQLAKQIEGSGCNKNELCKFPTCSEKLFLCSRDIQVGDTFTDNVGRLWENAEECFIKVAREANEQNSEYGKGSYKVIGEISPEATFVFEGQEFTVDEMQFQTSEHPPFEGWDDCTEKEYSIKKCWIKRIRIKCKCCNKYC